MMYLGILLGIFLLSQLGALWLISRDEAPPSPLQDFPLVSVLVAVRNEEENIMRCLESIHHLSYPKEKLEILIGDDQSNDQTAALIKKFIQDKAVFQYVYIDKKKGTAVGKANALAHLASEAKGQWFFFTDADIQLPQNWIESMLAYASPNEKVLMGFTTIEGEKTFHRLQAIDWCFALGMLYLFMARKVPVTAMGNNMAIHQKAYWAVGGYENLPPSIVEDFSLFQAIIRKGFDFKQIVNAEVLAISKPIDSYKKLLQQRKRWMSGAMQLPWHMQLYLFFQASFLPLVILLGFFYLKGAMVIFFIKVLLQIFFIKKVLKKVQLKYKNSDLLLYDLYASIQALVLILYYWLPTPIYWKGRKYK